MTNPTKLFPLIVTNKLAETRAYYVDTLGCEVVGEMDCYLQVRFGAEPGGPELSFMTPQGGPSGGSPLPAFGGAGLIVSIPTENADERHRALEKKIDVVAPPADKPWGWRSFNAADPNGVILDFFHVLDQAAVADATG